MEITELAGAELAHFFPPRSDQRVAVAAAAVMRLDGSPCSQRPALPRGRDTGDAMVWLVERCHTKWGQNNGSSNNNNNDDHYHY